MSRIGILSVAAPGHIYPLVALGKRLRSKGHEVVYFQVADVEAPIRAAGLEFHLIGETDFPPGTIRKLDDEIGRLQGLAGLRCAIRRIVKSSRMILRDAPDAVRKEGIDALIVDQCEMAGGAVADHLALPFVSAAAALPLNQDSSVPFVFYPWSHGFGLSTRIRNRLGDAFMGGVVSPVIRAVNQQRRAWGLPPCRTMNSTFSTLAQVSQLPAMFDLPGRRLPDGFHHTGPWTDPEARAAVDFPWTRLDPTRPLAYVSMGTLQNGVLRPYQIIAEACARTDLQLVISMGGGRSPSDLGDLPGDPIVVGYAPQLELIRRSVLTICHGGLNTVLESLESGVPTIVLPVTNDQPGVGARVEWWGVGRSIPVGRVTTNLLCRALDEVLLDRTYRDRAEALRDSIAEEDGLNLASDLVGEALERRSGTLSIFFASR